ncbi:MAG TPA: hypothetical protein VKK61_11495 [Tepidisphaeraceae bacterium]|nr:hypothetical protein [Tepidisphaeraceae bacterium]
MPRTSGVLACCISAVALLTFSSARTFADDPVIFNSGNPDGLMAAASRPASAGKIEIEAADDFDLTADSQITGGTFTGILSGADTTNISQVAVEIYRVFPLDSTDPPSGHAPTRVNSPSDVVFGSRDSAALELTFGTSVLSANFTAANSVLNGIHPVPNQNTGGEGSASGSEVQFNFTLATPLNLPANHYFFVPQVALSNTGNFYWLSAPKPIVSPGTPFPVGASDLQTWIRDGNLSPDWLRVGTDIVGGGTPPTFNMSFSLNGTVPEPALLILFPMIGLLGRQPNSRKNI